MLRARQPITIELIGLVPFSDLDDSIMVNLDPGARPLLGRFWDSLGEIRGSRWAWYNFRGVIDYLRMNHPRWTTLGTWRRFSRLTGFVNMLEKSVTDLQVSSGRTQRFLRRPRLPFNLATPAGGKVIGYRADSHFRNASFTNAAAGLHRDYAGAVREVLGEIDISESVTRGTFSGARYRRTNVGYLVASILRCADSTVLQIRSTLTAPFRFGCSAQARK